MTLCVGQTAPIRREDEAANLLYDQGLREQLAGRIDAAIALFDQAMRLKPDFPEALCSGGYILQGGGHAVAALAFYDRALGLKPDHAVAWFNRGCLLMEHNNFKLRWKVSTGPARSIPTTPISIAIAAPRC